MYEKALYHKVPFLLTSFAFNTKIHMGGLYETNKTI